MNTIRRYEARRGDRPSPRQATRTGHPVLWEICGVLILLGVIWVGMHTGFSQSRRPLALALVVIGAVLARPRRQ